MILRARYVVPVDGLVIEDGAVIIENQTIRQVTPWSRVDGNCDRDLGDVAVLPGLVNAHTHLELTHLAGRVNPSLGFTRWIEELGRVLRAMREQPDSVPESVRQGVARSLSCGVTTVGDIARHPTLTRSILRSGPLRAVSYGEVLAVGPMRQFADARLAEARDATQRSDTLRIGITPHSPYSVEADVFRACVKAAVEDNLPLCTHAAESPEEEEFTRRHQGPLRDLIGRLELWDDEIRCPGLAPLPFLSQLGALGPQTLLAHVNYIGNDDLNTLAVSGAHVAYCPRTHAAFGHESHPFETMMKLGINVCLGTDSLASNPSLSVLDEARFLRSRYESVRASLLLEMITLRGARALGLADRVGSLSPGKSADLTCIALDPDGPKDPVENVLCSNREPTLTMIQGRVVFP